MTVSKQWTRRVVVRVVALVVAATFVGVPLAAPFAAASTPQLGRNARDAALVPPAYRHVTLQVATDATYPPDEWMDGTTMVGLDVAMLHAIATTLGITIHENNVIFGSIVDGLSSGKYQIGNSSFTDTKASERQMNFVDYLRAGEGFLVRAGDRVPFDRLSNLCGQVVAVEQNSIEQAQLANVAKDCSAQQPIRIEAYSKMSSLAQSVLRRHATVGFLDSQVGGYLALTSKGALSLLPRLLNVVTFGIVTARTVRGRALAKAIRAAVQTLILDGTYQSLLSQWGASAGALALDNVKIDGAS